MGSRNNKPGRIVKGTAKQPTLKDASGIWSLDEAMQAHRANAWPQPNLLQPVGNSLRIADAKDSSLQRITTRDGNRYAWTYSIWFKKSTGLVSATWPELIRSLSPEDAVRIGASGSTTPDAIQIYFGATTSGNYFTTAVLRDPSAWYHLVVSVDSRQTTNTNRVKAWLNGVALTLNVLTYLTQGYAGGATSANAQAIGSIPTSTGAENWEGQVAEVNFIDGYQLQPTLFGQFDSNNTWVPIAYTGSYGTTGFYLPFNNATTSQTLGYDASLNGTAIYDADQDPYRGSVALHLTGNGPAGSNNNTFADSSPNNLAITRNGSVTQGSFSPFPLNTNIPYNPAIHGGSAYFGTTTSDNIYAASNSALTIGTNNFTLEFWANWTAWSGEQRLILMGQSGSSAIEIGRGTASNILQVYTNTSLKISYSWSPTIGAWNHIAVVRSGTGAGQLTLYINGVNVATGTSADSISTNNFFVGGLNWATGYNMQGYISNVRLINGAAVYTAAFTPTNRPFGTLTNNLITLSENFTSAWWANNTSNTEGTAIAPDGTPSATTLAVGTYPAAAGVGSSTVAVTGSIYAKANVGNQLTFRLNRWGSGADYVEIIFNLTTGTATGATTAGTASGLATSIVNVGNGWWRCIISGTTSTTGGAISFNPNPTSGSIFIWGAQLETGSTATNYTPTPANFSTAPALLLNFANAAVVDSAGAGDAVTVGNATITSSSKYGSGALTFNNSGTNTDYLNINNFDCTLAGNFTVEFWFRPQSTSTSYTDFAAILDTDAGSGSGDTNWWVIHQVNQTIYWATAGGAADLTTGNVFTTANEWYHVAFVRNNQKLSFYINGKEAASRSYTTTFGSVRQLRVGAQGSGSRGIRASIDDLRITKGVARYQDNFTPPARALPEVGGKSFVTSNINAGIVRSFTTTGTTSWTAPTDVTQVEVLVVAGGGSGGNFHGGGGGAGGLIYNNQYPVTPGQTYTVTVGAGGASTTINRGNNGGNSQFGNLIAIGGGGGGNEQDNRDGRSGGSGGGSSYGAGRTVAPGTAGQGFAGGIAPSAGAAYAGAGGGGAGGVGQDTPNTSQGGAGGVGLQFGISGTPSFYAAGGGGSVYNAAGIGIGGSGIGGNGGSFSSAIAATNGATNTGSGGGGGERASGANNSGAGGSGIVLIRYTTTAVGNTSDATTDNLTDSPTLYGHDTGAGGEVVGNYATFNPLFSNGQTYTLSNGNLTVSNPSSWLAVLGTIAVSTGKWYFESYPSDGVWHMTGVDQITRHTSHIGGNSSTKGVALVYDPSDTRGDISYNGGNSVYTGGSNTFNAGDVIGVALDLDNNNIKFYKNNVLQYNLSNILQAGASYTFGVSLYSGGTISGNFGQRAWAYAPPAGFNALTTKNLPRLTNAAAIAPNQYFDAVLYTGSGSARSVSGFNFAPDLLWVKDRSSSAYHRLFDRVRGATNSPGLYSNATSAEAADNLTFTSNGFSYTTDPYSTGMNVNNNLHVVWGWQAGGAAVANTSGTITSQVSANTTSGFSIVTWTGVTGGVGTIGHGLGTAPKLIITKQRNQTGAWYTYTTAIDGSMDYFLLNTNAAKGDSGLAVPTSTVFSNDGWTGTSNMVAYCWAEVAGFSKFGTYTGNGSADGPFVYLGFTPRFVMVKKTDSADQDWYIWDTTRSSSGGNNALDLKLYPNQTYAENGGAGGGESTSTNNIDAVSNGFKLRSANAASNASGASFIYMAFAGKPFGNVNGTAR